MKKSATSASSEDGGAGPSVASSSIPLTLGRKLASRREAEGLTLEEAAKALHLRPALLRELENDDLRSFSHASYARLTILGYARFLRIPQSEVQPWLPEIGELATEPHQYLDHYAEPQPAARRIDYVETRSPAKNPLIGLIKLFLVVVVILLIGYGWIIYINLGRIQHTGAGAAAVPAAGVEEAEDEEFVGLGNKLDSFLVPSPLIDQDNLVLELSRTEAPTEPGAGLSILESEEPLSLENAPELPGEPPLTLTEPGEPESIAPGSAQPSSVAPRQVRILPALPDTPLDAELPPDAGESTTAP